MKKFKVELKNCTVENNFLLNIYYKPENSIEEIEFTFRNSSKSLERNSLEFLDADGNVISPIVFTIFNPIKRETVKKTITKESPFIYQVKGIINNKQDKVHLDLGTVEYLFDLNKQYFVQLKYNSKVSDKLSLMF
jgi:hypothetical protein